MSDEPAPERGATTWVVDEQAWEFDEETGGQVAMLVDSPSVQAGLWRPGPAGPGPVEVDLDHTEVVLVLSGTGSLEVNDGPPLDLATGRAVRIEAGSRTRWLVSADFSELWLYL